MAQLPPRIGEETPISGWAWCLRSQQPRGVDPHPRTDARDPPENGPRTVLFQWKTAPIRSMYGPRNPGELGLPPDPSRRGIYRKNGGILVEVCRKGVRLFRGVTSREEE